MKRLGPTQPLALLLAALVVAPAACNRAAPNPPPPEPPAATAPTSAEVAWVRARPAEAASLLEMPAYVVVAAQAMGAVTPPYPARVLRVHVRVGEQLARGAAVADVIMPQLVAAAGNWVAANTRVDAYARRKTQLETLRAEGLVRVAELADVETKLAEARADQQLAAATLRAGGMGPGDAAHVLAGGGVTTLHSPIDGVVTGVDVAVGETRNPDGKPLVRIAGQSAPRIEARLTHALPPAAGLEFVTPSGERRPVRLVSQSPVVDPRDGSRLSWFEPAAPVSLPGGLTGRLRILLPARARAVVVPASAVGHDEERAFVVRKSGDAATRVEVEVLSSSGADALVEGDVAVNDEVAADAARALHPDGGVS